jgi:site-specific DNA recombinase
LGRQVARPREEWIEVQVPPLVSESNFTKAKERMVKNKEQSQRSIRRKYLLSRRLRCGKCGYTFAGRTRKGHNQFYRCKGREQKPYSVCDMPAFRTDMVDNAVWDWVISLLLDPNNIIEGLRGMQEESRRKNKTLYDRLDLIQERLEDTLQQQEKLVDLYLSGRFDKDVLLERKYRLETKIASLYKEKDQLSAHLGEIDYTEKDIANIEGFCESIRENLDQVTYEGKRRILDLLDVRGKLAIENEEKVIYVKCIIGQQLLSVARTSHWRSNHKGQPVTLSVRLVIPHFSFRLPYKNEIPV